MAFCMNNLETNNDDLNDEATGPMNNNDQNYINNNNHNCINNNNSNVCHDNSLTPNREEDALQPPVPERERLSFNSLNAAVHLENTQEMPNPTLVTEENQSVINNLSERLECIYVDENCVPGTPKNKVSEDASLVKKCCDRNNISSLSYSLYHKARKFEEFSTLIRNRKTVDHCYNKLESLTEKISLRYACHSSESSRLSMTSKHVYKDHKDLRISHWRKMMDSLSAYKNKPNVINVHVEEKPKRKPILLDSKKRNILVPKKLDGVEQSAFIAKLVKPAPFIKEDISSLIKVYKNVNRCKDIRNRRKENLHDHVLRLWSVQKNREYSLRSSSNPSVPRRIPNSLIENIIKVKRVQTSDFVKNKLLCKLRRVAKENNLERVRAMLPSFTAEDINDRLPTILHTVSKRGYSKIVNLLLKHGVHPHGTDIFGNTPLHVAVISNHITVVSLLLQAGANPLSKNNMDKIPCYMMMQNAPLWSATKYWLIQNLKNKKNADVSVSANQKDEQIQDLIKLCSNLSVSDMPDQIQDEHIVVDI